MPKFRSMIVDTPIASTQTLKTPELYVTKFGNVSYIPQAVSCRINNFWITYTKTLKTDQYY